MRRLTFADMKRLLSDSCESAGAVIRFRRDKKTAVDIVHLYKGVELIHGRQCSSADSAIWFLCGYSINDDELSRSSCDEGRNIITDDSESSSDWYMEQILAFVRPFCLNHSSHVIDTAKQVTTFVAKFSKTGSGKHLLSRMKKAARDACVGYNHGV